MVDFNYCKKEIINILYSCIKKKNARTKYIINITSPENKSCCSMPYLLSSFGIFINIPYNFLKISFAADDNQKYWRIEYSGFFLVWLTVAINWGKHNTPTLTYCTKIGWIMSKRVYIPTQTYQWRTSVAIFFSIGDNVPS